MSEYAFPFTQVATHALQRLQQSISSKSRLDSLLTQIGWQADIAAVDLVSIRAALNWDTSLVTLAELADDLRYQRGDVLTNAETLFTAIKDFYQRIDQATTSLPNIQQAPFNLPGFWTALAQDLPPLLLAGALRRTAPMLYGLLLLIGVIEESFSAPTDAGRLPYLRVRLDWNALGTFIHDPVGTLSRRYGWGTNQVLDYQRIMSELAEIVSFFPVNAYLGLTPAAIGNRYYTIAELENLRIQSFILPFISGILPDSNGAMELGLSLTPIPTPSGSVLLTHTAPAGFALAPYLRGSVERSIALRQDLQLDFVGHFASDDAVSLDVLPASVHFRTNVSSSEVTAAVNLVGTPVKPIRFFGSDTTSRVELTGYALSVGLAGTVTSPELLLRIGTALAGGAGSLLVYLEPGDGDNFIAHAFGPEPIKFEIAGAITWSSRSGLGIDGAASLHVQRALNKKIGPLTLQGYTVSIAAGTDSPLMAAAGLSGSLKIGPVTATVEDIGVSFILTTNAGQKGLLDQLDVHWGFKGPTGIGIEVDSDALSGGGYLFLDPTDHTYAGVAHLLLKTGAKEINLNALGLLQTELPGNPDAYSLLLLITATFTPIQLGLGFTLNGIGGLLGVNRATDTDYLRGLVRGGHLDQLLFPANVLDNPAAALAIVDAAFPATEGRYVIGLLARLGWGTPTSLITLDVALLIELPSPVRLAILGVLETTLPSKDNDLLKLRADFLGTVDFGSKRAAFDATLSDSHLLAFALTGDLAFRFYQGNNPLFVITAGGFHPAFQPPAGANLTRLNRLTLALSRGNDLRVTLTSYFAVTSNTVQFGSRLELYYRIARGLHVEGYFGFDVLFQFSPFHVQAHVEAGVAIKYGSRELLSLHLSLDVTGPGPWHLWGSASFKVWFVRIHVDVDAYIGSGQTEPALPATDVKTLLVTALDAAASWEVEAPKTALPGGVVLRPVGTTSADFFLDPRGSLLLRQRVVPLGVQLGKYGRGPIAPASGRRFDLTELVVAGVHHPVATDKDVETVRDFFAPDQFQPLTDAQKLSLPSFQLLPCGLRLNSMAGLVADEKATLRVVEYEHKLLDGTSGGATTSRPPKMSARGYQQLVRGGALGQEVDAARPSARAPQPVNWAEDAFVVVHAATLEVYDPVGHARFATQVEAEQYRQALVAATPALAEEVLVVPAYQLELA